MTEDTKENNQLVKAKSSSLQKRDSNIVSRGLSDLALLDGEKAGIADDERLLQAKEWFKKGDDYILNKEYDKAIEVYTNGIELNPNDAITYNGRGIAYADKKQYDRAIEDYNKAIALDPNCAAAYYNRGMVYFHDIGNMDKAIENFNKLIELNPNDAEAYLHRGFAYNHKGDINRAISDFQKACDLGNKIGCEHLQKNIQAKEWFEKGTNYFKNKEYNKAIEAFTFAITLNPNYQRAYVGLGAAYEGKGQHDMAIENYTEAITLNPNNPTAYNNRGLIYYEKGQYDKAIEDFQKGRDLGGWDWMRTFEKVLRQK